MRNKLILLLMLFGLVAPARAQVSIGIGLPNVSIGINLPSYPQLVPVPGYPVYYAPQVRSNYFFYDGAYWIYQDDRWYASAWYNGPWGIVAPEVVPVYVLRIPVRYYRRPPPYFRGWQPDAPPRWDKHWGKDWERSRGGWDRWDRSSAPPPAPLPVYQRRYTGDRYPRLEQQQELQDQNYAYRPRDPVLREYQDARRSQSGQALPRSRDNGQRPPMNQPPPHTQGSPSQQRGQQPQQRAPEPRYQEKGPQGKGAPHESQRGQGQGEKRDGEKGGGRSRDGK